MALATYRGIPGLRQAPFGGDAFAQHRHPSLSGPGLMAVGAAHYEATCRQCHGSPAEPLPRVPSGMTPPPPDLRVQVGRWRPRELFYIVAHGIKFTGMPAWPAQERPDEVWAVVAFLMALPGIDRDEYLRLVRPRPAAPTPIAQVAAARCTACHGTDGRGMSGTTVPRIAGQRAEYLRLALEAYSSGIRHSGLMAAPASSLDTNTTRLLANYFSGLGDPMNDAVTVATQRNTLAESGDAPRGIPRCIECHGPAISRRREAYPLLAGQSAAYLQLQLDLFRSGRRGGSRYAHIMQDIAPRLTGDDLQAVTAYCSELE